MKTTGMMKRLLSVLFLTATLLGTLHYHKDLVSHHDCPVCTLQSNLSSGDTPSSYTLKHSPALFIQPPIYLEHLKQSNKPLTISTRAPPHFF